MAALTFIGAPFFNAVFRTYPIVLFPFGNRQGKKCGIQGGSEDSLAKSKFVLRIFPAGNG
jgi:hypothetical protein